jgi:predicted methyltransferase
VLRLATLIGALAAAVAAPLGPAGAPASDFPKPDRPVAPIINSTWADNDFRDRAEEIRQITKRLGVEPGMTIADIGAGDGYDSLRFSHVVGAKGQVIAEDIVPAYLKVLAAKARSTEGSNIAVDLGAPHDPRLPRASIDRVLMVHMYHEIQSPYALLYNLVPAFKPGGRLGVEELNRPTSQHGTPPNLLVCELAAVGYQKLALAPLDGQIGYFAVFAPPSVRDRPKPGAIKPCAA